MRRSAVSVFVMAVLFATSLSVPFAGAQEKLPQEVIIGTYSIGGIVHIIGVAVAKTTNETIQRFGQS